MKKFFDYLKHKPLALTSVIILCVLYFVMIFAPFFAPYSATHTFEKNTFHPSNVQLMKGGLKVREFRVINRSTWRYAKVKDEECIHSLAFFVRGDEYTVLGIFRCNIHLFGSDTDYPVYLLGADNLGRDLFSRIVYGSRISLTIGFVATAVSLFLAVLLGGVSGYFGGATDWTIMRFAEFFMLIPSLYFILFLRSLLNSRMDSGTSYMVITLILSLVGWPSSARTIRGMTHTIKREEFIIDADIEGVPSVVVIFKHIIPQMASLLIVSTALSVPGFIMSETTLSYLGLGISDPAVSWGALINRDISTLSNLKNFPWLLYPVFMLLLVTLAFNFLGDALRDFYDPYHTVFKRRSIKKRRNGSDLQDKNSRQNAEQFDDNALLSVRNLNVTFLIYRGAKQIMVYGVRGVSFDVKRGEILGIVGESGSGKSVSTMAITGLLSSNAKTSGDIYYDGANLMKLEQNELRKYRGQKIALIFQEPGRSFDPLQNIGSVFFETFRVTEKTISREESDKRAASLLAEVGLPESEKRLSMYPHQFSGGQLQRIGIALAFAQNAELLIADEPTTALDVTIQAQIISLLLRLQKEKGLSIIFISHNIHLVGEISDRIAVMYGGKIMEIGNSREIMENPHHPYTRALVGALPQFGAHYTTSRMASIPGKVCDPANPPKGCPFSPRCQFAKEECSMLEDGCVLLNDTPSTDSAGENV